MKIQTSLAAVIAASIIATSNSSWAWGERGHNTTGYAAARLVVDKATPAEREMFQIFFGPRTHQFGHLNNVPDVSWRDERRPSIVKLNSPTHYVDTEVYAGEPPKEEKELSDYLNKMRSLPKSAEEIIKAHPHVDFGATGIAPWHIGYLYEQLVGAFKCAAKTKKIGTFSKYKNPLSDGKFQCSKGISKIDALSGAVQVAGIMGHFIADLAQPYHVTGDYDGRATGQAGLHSYFENAVVQNLDDALLADVLSLARSEEFQKETRDKIWAKPFNPVTVSLSLAADSFPLISKVRAIDEKVALIANSKVPKDLKQRPKSAVRRDPTDAKVQDAFRPLIVRRLATGALILSDLWYQAWIDGGRPELKPLHMIAAPYPLDVPFLKPETAFLKVIK